VIIRAANADDFDALVELWHAGWRDAHLAIVSEALARVRTIDNFRLRLRSDLPDVRVAGAPGRPLGFHTLKGGELNQFYVAASARGTGLAAALMADAEAQLAARGVARAWLACAIGNARAARFYEKCGWRRASTFTSRLDTPDGVIPLEVWRYEKALTRRPAA
jgi:GNAT superfamily N-acetyltransferase